MRHLLKHVVLLALFVAAVVLVTRWPRINSVETGRTPEYPALTVRDYGASEEKVGKAVRGAIGALARWSVVGGGRGPGGSEIQAEAGTLVGYKSDVFVRVRRTGSRTTVSVLSRSRVGPWDFGQNARNIDALLKELDRQMFLP
jgi:hypothetical protein